VLSAVLVCDDAVWQCDVMQPEDVQCAECCGTTGTLGVKWESFVQCCVAMCCEGSVDRVIKLVLVHAVQGRGQSWKTLRCSVWTLVALHASQFALSPAAHASCHAADDTEVVMEYWSSVTWLLLSAVEWVHVVSCVVLIQAADVTHVLQRAAAAWLQLQGQAARATTQSHH